MSNPEDKLKTSIDRINLQIDSHIENRRLKEKSIRMAFSQREKTFSFKPILLTTCATALVLLLTLPLQKKQFSNQNFFTDEESIDISSLISESEEEFQAAYSEVEIEEVQLSFNDEELTTTYNEEISYEHNEHI
ncbi:MAG: hypothetical protein KBC84_07460 [Proteobacteria bacterium]|nr:hypothetical protein [Pseudomonadota bacterium]